MAFILKKLSKEEAEELCREDGPLYAAYLKSGGEYLHDLPDYLAIDEEENVSFGLLEMHSHMNDRRHRFLLRVENEYIVFQYKKYTDVIFLHSSPLLEKHFDKVKHLICEGFKVAGRLGNGNREGIPGVPFPLTFKFDPRMGN